MSIALLTKAVVLPLVCAIGMSVGSHRPVEIDRRAPVITRDDLVIHAPLDRIWKIQTDVEAWPAWQPDVTEAVKQTVLPFPHE